MKPAIHLILLPCLGLIDHAYAYYCVVNSLNIKTWHEDNLTRRKTGYSCSEEGDCEAYCHIFVDETANIGSGGSNIQCYWDNTTGWQIDASYVLGVAGDSVYYRTLDKSRETWMDKTGCDTGTYNTSTHPGGNDHNCMC